MTTLLRRSDAPLYYIYVGPDCADFVQRMTRAHCFDMEVVLHAPGSPMSESGLSKYIQSLDCHAGKAWFQGSWTQAVAIFGSVLVELGVQAESTRAESTIWIVPPSFRACSSNHNGDNSGGSDRKHRSRVGSVGRLNGR